MSIKKYPVTVAVPQNLLDEWNNSELGKRKKIKVMRLMFKEDADVNEDTIRYHFYRVAKKY